MASTISTLVPLTEEQLRFLRYTALTAEIDGCPCDDLDKNQARVDLVNALTEGLERARA